MPLSSFDDPGLSNAVDELVSELQGGIFTASGILIAIPLLELTLLSTIGGLTKTELGLVAIPVLVSAILFALAILFTFLTKRWYLGYKLISALGKSLSKRPDKDWKKLQVVLDATSPDSAKRFTQALFDELAKAKSPSYVNWGMSTFIFGIITLVASFVILALFLL